MNFDLRLTIGSVFSIFGIFSNPEIYHRSLGININLWWGLVLLLFGAVMLFLGLRKKGDGV